MNNKEKYASLLVHSGVNIQPGQTLVIRCDIENADFAYECAKIAYDAGAANVVLNWREERIERLKYLRASKEVFDEVPEWSKHFYNDHAEMDAAMLILDGSSPDFLKGIDPVLVSSYAGKLHEAYHVYYDKAMNNFLAWCVSAVPTKAWAQKVYPDLEASEAYNKLFDAIIHASRADLDDPLKAWEVHQNALDSRVEFMTTNKFEYLHYKSSLGTDLTVKLVDNHIWIGGADKHRKNNYPFLANIPTEEIFTMPDMNHVDGKVFASYPLAYQGSLIEDFWFEFKDGSIIDFGAKSGYETIDQMLKQDDGAKRLGEVALVPYDSPISNLKTLFYQTLYDENASCHFAIGRCYPTNIEGGDTLSKEDLLDKGGNFSKVHVDFMIGTEDLEITGIKQDGSKVPVFVNGNFAFES